MNSNTTVTTAALATALGAILVWVLALLGVIVPPGIDVALVTVITVAITYLVPARKGVDATDAKHAA